MFDETTDLVGNDAPADPKPAKPKKAKGKAKTKRKAAAKGKSKSKGKAKPRGGPQAGLNARRYVRTKVKDKTYIGKVADAFGAGKAGRAVGDVVEKLTKDLAPPRSEAFARDPRRFILQALSGAVRRGLLAYPK